MVSIVKSTLNEYNGTIWYCLKWCRYQYWYLITLSIPVANLPNTKLINKHENEWNPGTWILIWECSERAIQWIPTWQGSDDFQRSLLPCALDESSLSIVRIKSTFKECNGKMRYCLKWCRYQYWYLSTVSNPTQNVWIMNFSYLVFPWRTCCRFARWWPGWHRNTGQSQHDTTPHWNYWCPPSCTDTLKMYNS